MPESPARTGVWVGIGAISMSFAAYTSAMVARAGTAPEWQHFRLPPVLYLNTLVLLASSVTLEMGRRRMATAARRPSGPALLPLGAPAARLFWLRLTLALGLLFLAGQCLAWRELASQGLLLSTGPSSAFFYVFTVIHALHLLGGLVALGYVLRRANRVASPRTVGAFDAAALYWHFVGVLWLYLLLLLALWL